MIQGAGGPFVPDFSGVKRVAKLSAVGIGTCIVLFTMLTIPSFELGRLSEYERQAQKPQISDATSFTVQANQPDGESVAFAGVATEITAGPLPAAVTPVAVPSAVTLAAIPTPVNVDIADPCPQLPDSTFDLKGEKFLNAMRDHHIAVNAWCKRHHLSPAYTDVVQDSGPPKVEAKEKFALPVPVPTPPAPVLPKPVSPVPPLQAKAAPVVLPEKVKPTPPPVEAKAEKARQQTQPAPPKQAAPAAVDWEKVYADKIAADKSAFEAALKKRSPKKVDPPAAPANK